MIWVAHGQTTQQAAGFIDDIIAVWVLAALCLHVISAGAPGGLQAGNAATLWCSTLGLIAT
jgi:hypothetical protein